MSEIQTRILSPEALRALAEAEQRREALDQRRAQLDAKPEINGRGGLDPVRYTDWEKKGIACDF
jgi:hypothetical protein